MAWVIRNQFGRRNLNDFQRAELALKLKPLIEVEAKANQKSGGATKDDNTGKVVRLNSDEPLRTDASLAKQADVGKDTIRNVEKIKESAAEPIANMARAGDVSIDAAAKVATLPKAEQRAVAKRGPKAVKAKA